MKIKKRMNAHFPPHTFPPLDPVASAIDFTPFLMFNIYYGYPKAIVTEN
jgi:hypothetical protein